MAEIKFDDLLNQLKPMEQLFYDQQFEKLYDPTKTKDQQSSRLTGQNNYEKMKAAYEAQQEIPEKGIIAGAIDTFNPFSKVSAAEPNFGNTANQGIFSAQALAESLLPDNLSNLEKALISGNRNFLNNTNTPFNINLSQYDQGVSQGIPIQTQAAEAVRQRLNIPPDSFYAKDPFVGLEYQDMEMPTSPQIAKDTIASNLLYDDLTPVIDTSFGVANEPDVEEEEEKSKGIGSLFEFLSRFSPVRGIAKLLEPLNARIQSSDFAQAKNLADYLDMRSYGGLRERENRAAQTMAQARGLQKQMAQRPSATPSARDLAMGRGEGDGPQRDAAATRSRDLGSMRGGVGR
jgi:hypothetical protein|tara:strand:- start:79 stop:1116 length:1038 start_codon:yes stop_codon:yes gene_type:complete